MLKPEEYRMMAADKRRQAEAAHDPLVAFQCLELAKSYERRAEQAETRKPEEREEVMWADRRPPRWALGLR